MPKSKLFSIGTSRSFRGCRSSAGIYATDSMTTSFLKSHEMRYLVGGPRRPTNDSQAGPINRERMEGFRLRSSVQACGSAPKDRVLHLWLWPQRDLADCEHAGRA